MLSPRFIAQSLAHPASGYADSASKLPTEKFWYAIYTASRHEKVVHTQLTTKCIECFLPAVNVLHHWKNGISRWIEQPLFPGYLFVKLADNDRLRLLQTFGVLYVVGNGAREARLRAEEIDILRSGLASQEALPHAYVCSGTKVRIRRGTFAGVEGYVDGSCDGLTVVITISLIQRSFSVRVAIDDLEHVPAYANPLRDVLPEKVLSVSR